MRSFDEAYIDVIREIVNVGSLEDNRTGDPALTIPSAYIKHDMSDGFPLLELRRIPFRSIRVELNGFIQGISSKAWYKERKCKYWNEWANPKKVPYGNDSDTLLRMEEEDDLGIIYGTNWRSFGVPIENKDGSFNIESPIDQLKEIVLELNRNPQSRRMVCTAWNPLSLEYAALPACHVLWRVQVINNKLHLSWFQRSTDYILGFPSNMASYAMLLNLLSLQSGFEMGTITAHLDNVHIYESHKKNAFNILMAEPEEQDGVIQVETHPFKTIFNWDYMDTKLINYNPHITDMKFKVSV